MKTILLLLACCLSSLSLLHGDPVPLNRDVEKPPCTAVLNNPQSPASPLQVLLEQGKLEEFYQQTDHLLQDYVQTEEKKDVEQLQNELWIFYDVAAAPLFQIDEDPDTFISWKCGKTMDYRVKTTVVRYIATLDMEELSSDLSIPREKLFTLFAGYAANILKTVRNSYDPELDIKQKRWEIEESDKIRKLFHEGKIDRDRGSLRFRFLEQKINIRDMRNTSAKANMESQEETFMDLMVKFFPGNTAKVKKYIKLAGYQDRDIPALIDRTVGRTPKTKFLYEESQQESSVPK